MLHIQFKCTKIQLYDYNSTTVSNGFIPSSLGIRAYMGRTRETNLVWIFGFPEQLTNFRSIDVYDRLSDDLLFQQASFREIEFLSSRFKCRVCKLECRDLLFLQNIQTKKCYLGNSFTFYNVNKLVSIYNQKR
jgi:hypothetical protein